MPSTQRSVTLGDTITWSGKQLITEISGEVVLMNIELGRYYSLDDIGSEIWRSLEKAVAVGTLCQALADRYKADSATVATDVLALLNKLLEQQLIVVVGA
jgi:hypothetical protein